MTKHQVAISFSLALLTLVPKGNAGGAKSLYLLCTTTGTEERVPVDLWRTDASAPSAPVLVTRIAGSADRVLVDADRRRMVVAYPAMAPKNFVVIDMDSPSSPHEVHVGYDSQELLPEGVYLLDIPGKGESIGLPLGRLWREPRVPYRRLTIMSLNKPGSAPTGVPMDALRFIRLGGSVGGALPQQAVIEVAGDPLSILLADPIGWSLGLPRPSYVGSKPPNEAFRLVAKSDTMTAISSIPTEIHVLASASQNGRRIVLPFRSTRIRAFGPWIAAIGEDPGWLAKGDYSGTRVVRAADQPSITEIKGRSPGQEKRRSERIGARTTVDDLFNGMSAVFPGELLICNALSGVQMRISTGQGDSEVLLVTDDKVFYRVNDEIYSAAILDGALGNPVRLAASGEVVQAHWAFLGN